jgi:hypothetical protein
MNDQLSTKTDKNSLTTPLNKDSLDYQLIHLHTSSRTTPIMQLVNGKQINFNEDIMNRKIDELQALKGADKSKYDVLKGQIKRFFANSEKAVYILYQQAPPNLISTSGKNAEILQLDDLQCIMANVTDEFISKEQETAPKSIEMKKEAKLPRSEEDKAADILPSLTTKNTFKDFGVTIKKPFPVVCSITQMTGTILNATYINKRLKKLKGIDN